ncbi:hypothetical protein Hamer_G020205 [Homarus americanus]|uniref:Uncharacterized protein n=1 Tax=Homarus americanus TaxID=6706 RepID=A0A8J5N5K2_HOMAM|nr:hypothetical protein Hamer_G020205 [Homarus americanus]
MKSSGQALATPKKAKKLAAETPELKKKAAKEQTPKVEVSQTPKSNKLKADKLQTPKVEVSTVEMPKAEKVKTPKPQTPKVEMSGGEPQAKKRKASMTETPSGNSSQEKIQPAVKEHRGGAVRGKRGGGRGGFKGDSGGVQGDDNGHGGNRGGSMRGRGARGGRRGRNMIAEKDPCVMFMNFHKSIDGIVAKELMKFGETASQITLGRRCFLTFPTEEEASTFKEKASEIKFNGQEPFIDNAHKKLTAMDTNTNSADSSATESPAKNVKISFLGGWGV